MASNLCILFIIVEIKEMSEFGRHILLSTLIAKQDLVYYYPSVIPIVTIFINFAGIIVMFDLSSSTYINILFFVYSKMIVKIFYSNLYSL